MKNNNNKKKVVCFNDKVEINYMVCWEFAYRKARVGIWEQMARDRVRFKRRIEALSHILNPVLKSRIIVISSLSVD